MAKILVVEDEQLVRAMLTRRLTWEGYEVVTAEDGAQGVALARLEQPDVILMDMGLPILSGWQATSQIKTASDTRAIPIIALTAYATPADRTRCLDAGCDAFESKPLDFPRLRAKIEALLGRKLPVETPD